MILRSVSRTVNYPPPLDGHSYMLSTTHIFFVRGRGNEHGVMQFDDHEPSYALLFAVILGSGILVVTIVVISINLLESRHLRKISEHRGKLLDRLLPISVSRRIQEGEFIADWLVPLGVFASRWRFW